MRIESVVVAVGAADNAVVAEMLLAEMLLAGQRHFLLAVPKFENRAHLVGPSRWELGHNSVSFPQSSFVSWLKSPRMDNRLTRIKVLLRRHDRNVLLSLG